MRPYVSRGTLWKLDKYVQLLREWSPVLNLIGRPDYAEVWERHIEDSLQLQAYVPAGTTSFVDVGSGAGFPGIPLALVSGMYGHFIEADSRKAAFLEVAVSELKLPAHIWNNRAETVSMPQQPLCTARAVAPLKKLINLCRPLMLPTGTALFPKGRYHLAEIATMRSDSSTTIDIFPSATDPEAAILAVTFQGGYSA